MSNHDRIPDELRQKPGWLLWRSEATGGSKPRKVPYYINGNKRHGEQGGAADRAALATFNAAVNQRDESAGLGFAMLADWGLVCVDLDGCFGSDGSLDLEAQTLVDAAGATYVELSPSGKGLHIWLRGSFRDEKNKDAGVESFCGQHYLTMTGKPFGNAPSQIAEMSADFRALLDARLRLRRSQASSAHRPRNLDVLLHDLRSALPFVNADDRDTWLETCWAVGRDTEQSPEGFEIVLEWATGSAAHNPSTDPAQMRREYFERTSEPRGRQVTTRSVFKKAREAGWRPDRERIFNADQARVSLSERVPEPEFIVPGYLPFGTVGGLPAEGGMGKTTFTLWEGAHIALGRKLFGAEVKKPGAVLFITAEDDRANLIYRLQAVVHALNLSPAEIQTLEQNIFIEDMTGRMVRLIEADDRGNLTRTFVGDVLIDDYKDRGVVLVNLDPINLAGPGERYVNDGEAAMMQEGHRIARELKCTVRYVHHIGKANARDGVVDQYVGRGGSAFADNSRFLHQLVRHSSTASGEQLPPLGSAAEIENLQRAVEEGKVLRLHTTKLSWAPLPQQPLWLVREGLGGFRVLDVPQMSRGERREQQERQADDRVIEYVRTRVAANERLSETELVQDHRGAMGLSRDEARRVLTRLLAQGRLLRLPLPAEERRGQRKSYIAAVPEDRF